MPLPELPAPNEIRGMDPDGEPFRRTWGQFFLRSPVAFPIDEYAPLALEFLTRVGKEDRREPDPRLNVPIFGALRVLERTVESCDELAAAEWITRVATLCHAAHVDVAATAVRWVGQRAGFERLAIPHLLAVARSASDHPRTPPITLRGLAVYVLNQIDPDLVTTPELSAARRECAQGCFEWSRARNADSEKVVFTANRLLWFDDGRRVED